MRRVPAGVPPSNRVRGEGARDRTRRAERFEAARDIVGYDGEDEWRVLLTRELIVTRASALAVDMVRGLCGYAEPGRRLASDTGDGPLQQVDQLRTWISALDAPFNEEIALASAAFARAHTSRGDNPGMQVKARHLLAAFAALQSAITALLFEYIGDAAELQAAISAWNKLLMLHLDVVLATYDSLASGTHWY